MPFDATPPAEVTARDRVIQLRDFLAELPEEKFNMKNWAKDGDPQNVYLPAPNTRGCGTVCCIGGWAETLFWDGKLRESVREAEVFAGRVLGLSVEEAEALFYPQYYRDEWSSITPSNAVAVLDHYLRMGEINWSVVL